MKNEHLDPFVPCMISFAAVLFVIIGICWKVIKTDYSKVEKPVKHERVYEHKVSAYIGNPYTSVLAEEGYDK